MSLDEFFRWHKRIQADREPAQPGGAQGLGLLAAAAKHEGITTLKAHHAFAFAGLGQQQRI